MPDLGCSWEGLSGEDARVVDENMESCRVVIQTDKQRFALFNAITPQHSRCKLST